MIVTVNRFRAPADRADAIERALRERGRRVDAHPGFLGLEVLRSFEPEPEFLLVTRWQDRDALNAYLRSDDFKATRAASSMQDASFSMYEVVAS